MSDVADVYARLRSETAKLLGFDVAALSPAQDVRVSMVAGLRLEFDRLQMAQLRGEAIDPKALVAISEQLEAALRPAEVAEKPGSSEAHRKLAELLEGRHRAMLAEWERESALESEVAADFYRDAMRPPSPARIGPPVPARHVYIDAGVLDDDPSATPERSAAARAATAAQSAAARAVPPPPVPVSVRAAPQQSSDREWLRWYRGGGGVRQAGWDSPPKGW